MSNTTCATRDANEPSVRELLPPGLPLAAASSVSVEQALDELSFVPEIKPSLKSRIPSVVRSCGPQEAMELESSNGMSGETSIASSQMQNGEL